MVDVVLLVLLLLVLLVVLLVVVLLVLFVLSSVLLLLLLRSQYELPQTEGSVAMSTRPDIGSYTVLLCYYP